jgi:dihydroorotate dehydrogenase (NAD+) catalytic subunit
MAVETAVRIGSVALKNPVIAASGCYNRGAEYARIIDVAAYGAITIKSITRQPRLGNSMPRVMPVPGGLLNAIGLQGPGIDHFLEHDAPKLAAMPTVIFASVAGFSVSEFADVAARMDGLKNVVAIELDVSCPNVDREGECFAESATAIGEVVRAVKAATTLPIIAKLTPNVADLKPIAAAAEAAGADAISLINAVRGMVIDTSLAKPWLANGSGGLTGPAIRPIAVLAVWEVAKAVRIPIIGMGGIETGRDALEFMLAGATAVGVGTANFRDPDVAVNISAALVADAERRGFNSVSALTGLANPEFAGTRVHV